MDVNKSVQPLSQEAFETFILIYAAHIDFDFSDQERVFILERTSKETFNQMLNKFLSMNDYLCMKFILSHRSLHFDTKEKQDKLFNLLKELFSIDGEFSRLEKQFVPFFEKMINLNLE